MWPTLSFSTVASSLSFLRASTLPLSDWFSCDRTVISLVTWSLCVRASSLKTIPRAENIILGHHVSFRASCYPATATLLCWIVPGVSRSFKVTSQPQIKYCSVAGKSRDPAIRHMSTQGESVGGRLIGRSRGTLRKNP